LSEDPSPSGRGPSHAARPQPTYMMRVLAAVLVLALAALGSLPSAAAACRVLHGGYTWVIVESNGEAVEYSIASNDQRLRIYGLSDEVIHCTDCAKVQLRTASSYSLLSLFRAGAEKDGFTAGASEPVKFGNFQGVAQSFTAQEGWSALVTEATDGCVIAFILVDAQSRLDNAKFGNPKSLSQALHVERVSRGPAHELDLNCFKQRDYASFAGFESWLRFHNPQPIPVPPYSEFLEQLRQMRE
jgi:hypothetical protein